MSLSKVYEKDNGFTPQDIVQRRYPHGQEPQDSSTFIPDAQKETAGFVSSKLKHIAEPLPAPSKKSVEADVEAAKEKAVNSPTQEQQKQHSQEPPPAPANSILLEDAEQMAQEAFTKGMEEGLKQAEEEFGSATQALLKISQQLDTLHETILKNSAGEMQNLALTVAEMVLRDSIAGQKKTIQATLDAAIQAAVKSEEMTVFVNPADYEILISKAPEIQASFSGLTNLYVKKDSTVEQGGCRLESDNCTVDATIGNQLRQIFDTVKQQV